MDTLPHRFTSGKRSRAFFKLERTFENTKHTHSLAAQMRKQALRIRVGLSTLMARENHASATLKKVAWP